MKKPLHRATVCSKESHVPTKYLTGGNSNARQSTRLGNYLYYIEECLLKMPHEDKTYISLSHTNKEFPRGQERCIASDLPLPQVTVSTHAGQSMGDCEHPQGAGHGRP